MLLITNVYKVFFCLVSSIADFRRLYQIDNDFRHAFLAEFQTFKNWTKHKNDLYKYRGNLVGSLREGAFFARFFKQSRLGTNNFNRGIDVDLEITLAHIREKQQHCVQDLTDKPGFTNYAGKSEDCHFFSENLIKENDDFGVLLRKDGFLKPNNVKKIFFRDNTLSNHTTPLTTVKAVFAYLYKTSMANVNIYDMKEEITKATATFSGAMQVYNYLILCR